MAAPKDPRWGWVDQISDLLAVLATIEEHRHFITTHAANADMHNVVLNLRQILHEARQMNQQILKLRAQLAEMQTTLIQAIYQTDTGGLLIRLHNQRAAGADHAYLIAESQQGRRCRRVRVSDYVRPETADVKTA